MEPAGLVDSTIKFGVFEVDPRSGELRKSGSRIKLQEQPFKVLLALLEHPGEVVTREELRRRIWPTESFGDFDHAVNVAVAKLRTALGDSADIPRYVETLPRRGYRFVFLVTPSTDRRNGFTVGSLEHESATAVEQPERRPTQWRSAKLVGLAVGVVASLTVLSLALNVGRLRERLLNRSVAPHIESLAVLPLENLSGDPQQEYFADGLTESLITDLGRLTGLKGVIARGSVMRYKGTKMPIAEIARDLKVDAIITGAVLRSANRVRITAQLIDPKSGKQLWTEHYERDLSDVLRLQNEVTSAIAGEIRVKLTENEQARLAYVHSVDPQAYDAYLMGRFHWYKMTPQGLDTAEKYFQIALDRDPNYAPAYAGIGDVWTIRAHTGLLPVAEGYAKARAAAVKALELDSMLPEAHGLLATVLAWHEWDWNSGEKEYRRAIELNPNYALARCFYSLFLHAMRRPQEARIQIDRALELDPYNYFFHMALAMQLMDEHQPDESFLSVQRAAALQPDSLFQHSNLWYAFAQKNQYEKALVEAKQYFTLLGAQDVVQTLDRGYKQGGYRHAMRMAADALATKSKRSYISTMDVVFLYTDAGEYDRALDCLDKAYLVHDSRLPYINVFAPLDPLRSQPRFQDLIRRMNFPP